MELEAAQDARSHQRQQANTLDSLQDECLVEILRFVAGKVCECQPACVLARVRAPLRRSCASAMPPCVVRSHPRRTRPLPPARLHAHAPGSVARGGRVSRKGGRGQADEARAPGGEQRRGSAYAGSACAGSAWACKCRTLVTSFSLFPPPTPRLPTRWAR